MRPDVRMVVNAFGRLMHRIARPVVHARRLRRHIRMAWWEIRSDYRDREMLREEARQSIAECLKILLALTGLPQVYRALDRWRRRDEKTQLSALDPLTQAAVRLFVSHLDTALLPPMSKAVLYGSRARGDHRVDSDVDILLVFAGAKPDFDGQAEVCNALADAQFQANEALQSRTEVTSFVCWQDEVDAPDKRRNPVFFQNVLADGIDVTCLYASQSRSGR